MKRILFIFTLFYSLLNAHFSFAQMDEPMPRWAKSTPVAPNGTNTFYAWGVGEGNNKNEAWTSAELWAIAAAVGRSKGFEVPRTTLDSLRFSPEFRERIRVQASKFPKEHRTETSVIKMGNGRVKIYVLFEFIERQGENFLYGTEDQNDVECDRKIESYNKSITLKNRNWRPLGLKQFQSGSTTWENVRGGIWLTGQVGGLAGSIIYGIQWSNRHSDLVELEKKLNAEPYGDVRADLQRQINDKKDAICNSQLGFGLSVGAMALFYGLNVWDNCHWTRTNKRGEQTSLSIMPYVTPQSNGIGLAYKF